VDPVTIGMTVAALVAKRFGEHIGQASADAAWAALGRLVERVRLLFAERTDVEGRTALARLEDAPDSPSRRSALAAALDRAAAADAGVATELHRLVDDVKSAGVQVKTISQHVSGRQNVQFGDAAGAEIHVNLGGPPIGSPGRPVCPFCGSDRVKKHRVLSTQTGQSLRCQDCHHWF
jgi:hypothetical protein